MFLFIDVHIFRAYYTAPYILDPFGKTYESFEGRMTYTVNENSDGLYDFEIKNNSFGYHPIILYRDDVWFDLNDTVFFNYAGRFKLTGTRNKLFDTGGGFDCGTGISIALIRPFESFQLKNQKLEDLLDWPSFHYRIQTLERAGVDFRRQGLFSCQFYLPIGSLGLEDTRVYSNTLEIQGETIYQLYQKQHEYYDP